MVSEGEDLERSELEKALGQSEAKGALRQAREMNDALNRINSTLHSTLDLAEIMQRLVAEGSALLGSESAAISLRRGDGWSVSHVHGMPSGLVGTTMEDDKERHAVLALQSREPVTVADAFNDERFNREHLRRHNIRAVLVVPLITRNDSFGVIFFNYHTGPHEFTDAEVNFARQLATTAAVALENARLFDEGKRAEETLRKARDELEARVEERTARLEEQKEEILAANLRLELAMSVIGGGIYEHSVPLDETTYHSERWAEIIGYSKEELPPYDRFLEWIIERIHPEDLDTLIKSYDAFLDGRSESYDVEARLKHKEGHWVWVHAVSHAVRRDRRGRAKRIVGLMFDITHLKHSEKLQKETQYLLEKTFASLNDAVLVVELVDPSTRRIIAVNPATERILGYSEQELIGRNTEILHVNKAMFERFGSELAAALDAKGVYQCEFQMRRKDGKIVYTEHTVSELLDESGKRTGAVSVVRDISERRAAEKKLLVYQDQLRSLSSELSLIEQRERRKFADDLHDSVAQLLVLAKFNLEEMQAKSPSGIWETAIEEVCQYLDEAMEQTRSMMYELSPPELHELGLKAGLGGLAKRIGHAHNLQVDFSADEIPEAALNEDASVLLYRSVQELLMNVLKHAGVSRAKLSLFREDDAIRVEVEDEGIGCDLPSITEYSKLDKGGGFGLLSIKERLLHLGGQFEISSEPGKGTRVTLTVPLQKETVVTIAEHVAPIRVLIADDHQMIREGLRSLLESQNFEIVGEAKDGEEAIRIARDTTPDVVIMDIEMSVMDGVEATRQILAELPQIRVIGLSMYSDKFRISQALESGASGFVLKGSAFQELNQAIHAVVNDKGIFLSATIRDLFPDSGEQLSLD